MVFPWWSNGVHIVFTWLVFICVHMVFTWCSLDVHIQKTETVHFKLNPVKLCKPKIQSAMIFIFPCRWYWLNTFLSEDPKFVNKLPSKIRIFQIFHYFENLRKIKPIIRKSEWWKFPNKISEMTDFFVFWCAMSWSITFLSETPKYVSKLASKIQLFQLFLNLWKMRPWSFKKVFDESF